MKPEPRAEPLTKARKKRLQIERFIREADHHKKLNAPRIWSDEEIWIEARQNLRVPIPSPAVIEALKSLMWSPYRVTYMGVPLRHLADVWETHRPENYLKEAA